MPGKQVRSELFKKLGTRLQKAHELHKGDETEFSQFGELPPGINGGIAQLVDCKFDTYKKGDLSGNYFFYAAGTVHLPLDHEGIRTEGLRTSIMEPLCDTPNKSRKTVEDHLGWIYNELRKLGLDTENLDFQEIEEAVEDLRRTKPYFRFRTWQGEATEQYPNPRVNHQWGGQVEYNPEDDAGAATEDSSDEVEEQPTPAPTPKNGKTGKKTPPTQVAKNGATATAVAPKGKKVAQSSPPEPEEATEDFDEFKDDLDSLAKRANTGKDDDAEQRLTDLAIEAGASAEDIENAADWTLVVEMINNPPPTAPDEEEETPEEPVVEEPEEEVEPIPEKGQLYSFKPMDSKTKQRAKKAVEVEVVEVDTTKKTVKLKNLDNPGLVYTGIKWELLGKIGG
jgi:hypothetical protein